MGLRSRVAKILSFTRVVRNGANISDVKVDPGGGPNITSEHFAPAGDDAYPLTTDYALTSPAAGSGRESVVGYVDPLNTPKALEGDKRIYARDKDTGAVVVELWQKNDGTATLFNDNGVVTLFPDGTITIISPIGVFTVAADGTITGSNAGGSFQLQTGGDFVVNGARITAVGEIINAAGIVLGTHTHSQGSDSDGDTQQETEAPS